MMEYLILGAAATGLVQWLKSRMGTSKYGTLCILVFISVVFAMGSNVIMFYDLWDTFVGVIATANLIYAFLIQHLEK